MSLHHDDSSPIQPPPYVQDDGPIYVSIFLIILCLFIVLTAMSKIDKSKFDQASQSLGETFLTPQKMIRRSNPSESEATPDFISQMSGWAVRLYPLKDIRIQEQSSMVLIGIPIRVFFDEESSALRETTFKNFTELSQLIKVWSQQYNISVEAVVTYAPDEAQKVVQARSSLASRRAAAIAVTMVTEGLNKSVVSPGIRAESDDLIYFRFSVMQRPLPNPKPNSK